MSTFMIGFMLLISANLVVPKNPKLSGAALRSVRNRLLNERMDDTMEFLVQSSSQSNDKNFAPLIINKIPAEIGTATGDYPFHLTIKVDYTREKYIQFCDATIYNDELVLSTLSCFNESGLMVYGKYDSNYWNFNVTLNTPTGHNLLAEGGFLGKTPLEEDGLVHCWFRKGFPYKPSYFMSFPKLWYGKGIRELENFGVMVLGKTEDDLERAVLGVIESDVECQMGFERNLKSYESCIYVLADDCKIYSSNPVLLAVSKQLIGLVTQVSSDGCHAIITTSGKIRQVYLKYLE